MIDKQTKQEMRESINRTKEYLNSDWILHGGYGQDDNMTCPLVDIYYTRKRYKKIAELKGFVRPYHFKRKDFHWEVYRGDYILKGKLILYDKKGNELESRDMDWLNIQSEESVKKEGKWLINHYPKAKVVFTIYYLHTSETIFQKKNIAAGGNVSEIEMMIELGKFKLYLIPSDTEIDLLTNNLGYHIRLTFPDEKTYVVIKNDFKIIA